LFLQLLTVLAEKPPASAGYRGSDLVLWRIPEMPPGSTDGRLRLQRDPGKPSNGVVYEFTP